MKKIISINVGIVVLLISSVFAVTACHDDDDNNKNGILPPENITTALNQLYPNVHQVEWEVEQGYYVADCWDGGFELEVWWDRQGNWVMTEKDLENVGQLPAPVLEAFQTSAYHAWRVDDVDEYTYPAKATEYLIELEQLKQKKILIYSADGKLITERNQR